MAGRTASYGDCVRSLQNSLLHLEGSVSTLGAGVSDYPRLVNVLKTVRVRTAPLPPSPTTPDRS